MVKLRVVQMYYVLCVLTSGKKGEKETSDCIMNSTLLRQIKAVVLLSLSQGGM